MDNRSVAGTSITQHEEKFRVYNEALIHSASCSDIQCPSNDGRCIKIKASITHFVQCYGPRRKTSPIERYVVVFVCQHVLIFISF